MSDERDDLERQIRQVGGEILSVMRIAERIRERMDVLGLNPYSAAKKAGLGADYVRDILRGKVKHPTAERLGRLAEALETSLQYLLGNEDIQGAYQDETGAPVLPPPPLPSAPDGAHKQALLLPIRYELMADTFRRATEVTRKPLGYEAATIPPAYRDRESWWELMRDESMAPFVPPGALVQVVAMEDSERHLIADDDIIVIQKRVVEEQNASFHIVERSLRIVSHRYPDLGLWFMEYGNEDWGISDDVFKEGEPTEPRRPLPQVMRDIEAELPSPPKARPEDTVESMIAAGASADDAARSIQLRDFLQRMDAFTPETMKAEIERLRRWSPKLVGKVIRVLIPTDARARFGTPPESV